MEKNATYTSVWDGGVKVTTRCKVDTVTKEVLDIEPSGVDGVEVLEDEYVTVDGKKIFCIRIRRGHRILACLRKKV